MGGRRILLGARATERAVASACRKVAASCRSPKPPPILLPDPSVALRDEAAPYPTLRVVGLVRAGQRPGATRTETR